MSKRLERVSIWLDKAMLERIDALADALKRPGREPVRTDAILTALDAGLAIVERDRRVLRRAIAKR